MNNLGIMNNWKPKDPRFDTLKTCVEAGHRRDFRYLNESHTYTEYTCRSCGITWEVDSSD